MVVSVADPSGQLVSFPALNILTSDGMLEQCASDMKDDRSAKNALEKLVRFAGHGRGRVIARRGSGPFHMRAVFGNLPGFAVVNALAGVVRMWMHDGS